MKKIFFIILFIFAQQIFSQSDKKTVVISNQNEVIYLTNQVSIAPQFNGGKEALDIFIKRNFNQPKNVKGEVSVSFIVEKDGSLSEIGVLSDAGNGTADEAIRVMSISPLWIAGTLNGNAVRVQYLVTIPIDF
ncbi:energy transducer TonB [Flavobacterium sp.]|uniref:energy transducer TonB n=1 Tax=Flavobacterium sp. TaxID=239 RepID=UPI0037519DD1